MKNVFLTGKKGCGKSTAIKRYLELRATGYGGFVTVKEPREETEHWSLYLLSSYADVPSEQNRLFSFGTNRPDADYIARQFDKLGCAALSGSGKFDLIIMDELGPHEDSAVLFQSAVKECLDSDIPVLGVLQEAEGHFLEAVKERADTLILTVTEDNRNDIPLLIDRALDIKKA